MVSAAPCCVGRERVGLTAAAASLLPLCAAPSVCLRQLFSSPIGARLAISLLLYFAFGHTNDSKLPHAPFLSCRAHATPGCAVLSSAPSPRAINFPLPSSRAGLRACPLRFTALHRHGRVEIGQDAGCVCLCALAAGHTHVLALQVFCYPLLFGGVRCARIQLND